MIVKSMQKTIRRLISLLVAMCLMITFMPTVSSADDGAVSIEEISASSKTAESNILPDGSINELKYVDRKELLKNGAVRRMKEKETLSSYAFLNSDGTESVVIFPENIKYINEKREIVNAGAKHAVGFTNTISYYEERHPSEIDVWTGAFFEAYSQDSEDIQECINHATEKLCNTYFTALMSGDHFGFGSAKYY